MTSTIKLPSGKLVDLSRFVALLPDNNTTETKYQLSLSGLDIAIELDAQDAEFINQKLKHDSEINKFHSKKQWDKEAQLRQNQPLMKLIKQWREEQKGQTATEEEIQEYRDIQESLKRKSVN